MTNEVTLILNMLDLFLLDEYEWLKEPDMPKLRFYFDLNEWKLSILILGSSSFFYA